MTDGPATFSPQDPTRQRSPADLIDATEPLEPTWSDTDLAAIWLHQLSAKVDRRATFTSALFGEPANVDSLQAVKDFAKVNLNSADDAFPKPIAWMLYIAAIVAASTRCNRRISSVADATLSEWMS